MFHKYNSFTNTLTLSDQLSAYVPQSFGTKEATNNFFLAPQPKGLQAAKSEQNSEASLVSASVAKLADKAKALTGSHGAVTESHGASKAAHGHGHGSHPAPWEGVNLWRTPYKGDTDTVTQIKRNKGTLDKYVEDRIRRIQQLQLLALRNKSIPTWVMLPRDKFVYVVQGGLVAYVLYQVTTTVYQHLKAKDRLKLLKLLYKDNVD